MSLFASACVDWWKCKNARGYGVVRVNGEKFGRTMLAHRFVWEECFGPIPEGVWVLHHCDNPSCVNPEHLYLGTHRDNMRDMVARGRAHRGFLLADEQVRAVREAEGTQRDIARRFGISQKHVGKIRRGEAYRCL